MEAAIRKIVRNSLNEEINRMRVLAGINSKQEIIEEGFLTNLAAGLGLTLSTITGIFGQTGNLDKLKYSKDEKAAIETAMKDPKVIEKLKELGVSDNNINRQIKTVESGRKITGSQTRIVHSEDALKGFMRQGYSLTSIERDTIIKILKDSIPGEEVTSLPIMIDNEAMFQSGKFEFNSNDIAKIKHILDSLEKSKSVLLNVQIISSTDGQGLSNNLKKSLTFKGLSPNNEGLSNARAETLKNAIINLGVDESIIAKPKILFKDDGVIDQGYRYVIAILDIVQHKSIEPETKTTITQEIIPTYKLIKPAFKRKRVGFRFPGTPIIEYHPAWTAVNKCFFPVPK